MSRLATSLPLAETQTLKDGRYKVSGEDSEERTNLR
ncbi:hypothetical protein BuS5_00937 [Desulfosarcina sp. BuS5]|nr:hypothetical protein BuS5_00937 [Desulfosarcina sp. BuS5]